MFVCCDQNWFQSECVFSNITKVERTKEDVATFIACASELGACTQLMIAVHNYAYLERPDSILCRIKGHARLGKIGKGYIMLDR